MRTVLSVAVYYMLDKFGGHSSITKLLMCVDLFCLSIIISMSVYIFNGVTC